MIRAAVLLALSSLPSDNDGFFCSALVLPSPPHVSRYYGRGLGGGRRGGGESFRRTPTSPSSSSWEEGGSSNGSDALRTRRRIATSTGTTSTALHAMRRHRSSRRRRRRRIRHGVDSEMDLESCTVLDKEDMDHQGLAKSIDFEYAIEEAKLELTFWDVLERERNRPPEEVSEKSRGMSPWARARRRMRYARGDTESKYALMAGRSYGEKDLLDQDHLREPPSLDDLNQSPPKFKDTYWSSSPFRLGVIAASYFAFPLFLKFFVNFETIDPNDFDIVVGQIAPNVGVLYATLLALTLQVLYQRFTRIQENVATESMLLSQVARNLLSLFAKEEEWAIESCQIVANQVRIMLSRTRGVELLSIMKADTYSNLMALIDDYHYLRGCDDDFTPQEESITCMLRQEIGQLMETRALRLSDEASSLPPTHFLLMASLSFVSIVAYVTASLKVVQDLWHPPQEASLLFAGLMALYILLFNICRDLNAPFKGVYQVKRSNAVSHLMQTKWLILKQLGDSVSFGVNYGEEELSEDVGTVDANVMKILVNELESRVETIGQEEELCEAALPAAASLDCLDDGREGRLLQMTEELARLKVLNDQLRRSGVGSSTESPDPEGEGRLHRMKEELDRLKQLNQQISNGAQFSETHNQHGAPARLDGLTIKATKELSAARAALQQASLKVSRAEISVAEATKKMQSTPLIESKTKCLADETNFAPKLESGLFLAGVGARRKSIITVYNVAMYCSPAVLEAVSSLSNDKDARIALHNAARTFDQSSPITSFVLNMVFKADAHTIAGAIAESVTPRYGGPSADVKELERLIYEGVKAKGGQATKGTVFRFDCSRAGVSVSVDGRAQGVVDSEGIGSAFVDIFADGKAVSAQLVNSCLDTWCECGVHKERENARKIVNALTKEAEASHSKEERARKIVNDLQTEHMEEKNGIEKDFSMRSTLDKPMVSDVEQLGKAEEAFKEEHAKLAELEGKRKAEEATKLETP